MGNAIGQTLSLAVGVALSPVPIIAVILMLVTPRARSNGPAFVVGWLVGLAIVGTVVLLVAGPANANALRQKPAVVGTGTVPCTSGRLRSRVVLVRPEWGAVTSDVPEGAVADSASATSIS